MATTNTVSNTNTTTTLDPFDRWVNLKMKRDANALGPDEAADFDALDQEGAFDQFRELAGVTTTLAPPTTTTTLPGQTIPDTKPLPGKTATTITPTSPLPDQPAQPAERSFVRRMAPGQLPEEITQDDDTLWANFKANLAEDPLLRTQETFSRIPGAAVGGVREEATGSRAKGDVAQDYTNLGITGAQLGTGAYGLAKAIPGVARAAKALVPGSAERRTAKAAQDLWENQSRAARNWEYSKLNEKANIQGKQAAVGEAKEGIGEAAQAAKAERKVTSETARTLKRDAQLRAEADIRTEQDRLRLAGERAASARGALPTATDEALVSMTPGRHKLEREMLATRKSAVAQEKTPWGKQDIQSVDILRTTPRHKLEPGDTASVTAPGIKPTRQPSREISEGLVEWRQAYQTDARKVEDFGKALDQAEKAAPGSRARTQWVERARQLQPTYSTPELERMRAITTELEQLPTTRRLGQNILTDRRRALENELRELDDRVRQYSGAEETFQAERTLGAKRTLKEARATPIPIPGSKVPFPKGERPEIPSVLQAAARKPIRTIAKLAPWGAGLGLYKQGYDNQKRLERMEQEHRRGRATSGIGG